MRMTIIKEGGLVSIDGLPFFGIDMSSLPSNFHALQWYGDKGEAEYIDQNTEQHTNAAVTDLAPYQAQINAWNVLKQEYDNPPPPVPVVPASITRRQCARQLYAIGMITGPEAVAMTRTGTPPAMVQTYLAKLSEADRYLAEMDFAADTYLRDNPLLAALMAANNKTDAEVDQFFIDAEAL